MYFVLTVPCDENATMVKGYETVVEGNGWGLRAKRSRSCGGDAPFVRVFSSVVSCTAISVSASASWTTSDGPKIRVDSSPSTTTSTPASLSASLRELRVIAVGLPSVICDCGTPATADSALRKE